MRATPLKLKSVILTASYLDRMIDILKCKITKSLIFSVSVSETNWVQLRIGVSVTHTRALFLNVKINSLLIENSVAKTQTLF